MSSRTRQRPRQHRPRTYRVEPDHWCWTCQCGAGTFARVDGAPDQHSAFIGALVHLVHNAG